MAVSTSSRKTGLCRAHDVSTVPMPYRHDVAPGVGLAVGDGVGVAAGVGEALGVVTGGWVGDEPPQPPTRASATARVNGLGFGDIKRLD